MSNKSVVVVGVGPARGLGAAIARRFAREGFRLTVLGRNAEKLNASVAEMRGAGAVVESVVGEVTDQATVARVVAAAEAAAPVEVAVFNAGGNWPGSFLDINGKRFEEFWRVNALAGLYFGQAALRTMLPRAKGTLIYTGASASLRGRRTSSALLRQRRHCARSRNPPRVNSGRRGFMSRISWSTVRSTASG